jgi:hypothetical protein
VQPELRFLVFIIAQSIDKMKQNALSPFPSFLHLSRKAPTLDQCQKIVVWLAKFHRSFWEKRKTVSKTAEAGLPVDVQQLVTGSDSKLWPLFMKSSEKERYELFELLDPDGFKVKKKGGASAWVLL